MPSCPLAETNNKIWKTDDAKYMQMDWMLNAIFFVDLTAFLELSMECEAQQCADVIDIFNQKGICGGTIMNGIDRQAPSTHNMKNENRGAHSGGFIFIFCLFILCYSLFTLEWLNCIINNEKENQIKWMIKRLAQRWQCKMQTNLFLKNSFSFDLLIRGIFICIIAFRPN